MAAEEDKKFNAALGGFLSESLRAGAERIHCPPPDILAAYHERSLPPEEMNSWKEHIVGCSNCQIILAHLETTDDIPLQAAENEELVAASQAVASMADTSHAVASASAGEDSAIRVITQAKKRETRFYQGPRWRWLAPAGAIAAGLLVWIAMHEKSIALHNAPETKIATNLPAAPPPSVAQPASSLPGSAASATNARSAPPEMAPSNGRVVSKMTDKLDSNALRDESKALHAYAPADKESGLPKDAEAQVKEELNRAANARDLDAKSATGAGAPKEKTESPAASQAETREMLQVDGQVRQQVEVQGQAAKAQAQNQVNSSTRSVPTSVNQAESTQRLKKAAPAKGAVPPAAPATGAMNYQTAASMDLFTASNLHLIPAPGGAIIWRVGPAGLIELSKDKGASWSPQASGVSADLLAGSAPSDKVCWLVGRAGTILFTNDAGAHWKSLAAPLKEELGGVRATDSLHATIWDLRNTRFFSTTDGGQTWAPAAAQ